MPVQCSPSQNRLSFLTVMCALRKGKKDTSMMWVGFTAMINCQQMGWGCLYCVLRPGFDQTCIFSCSPLLERLLFSCWNDNESPAQYIIIQLSFTFKHKKGRMYKHHGCSSHSVKDDGCSHTRGQLSCSEQTVWKCRKQSEAHCWVNTVVPKHSG